LKRNPAEAGFLFIPTSLSKACFNEKGVGIKR